MTAEIVNLKTVRKRRARADKDKRAEENRRRFGASKAERSEAKTTRNQLDSTLDGARREQPRLDDAHDDLDPGTVS